MSTELQDAFTRASEVAKAEFVTRDPAEIIVPTTRRVSRHRAGVRVGAGLASVAVLGGVLWGAKAVSDARVDAVDPALQGVTTSGVAVDPNPDVAVPSSAWTTLDLAVRAHPRKQGEVRDDGTAGMICNHYTPTDDPRVHAAADVTAAITYMGIEDCRGTWFHKGPTTSLTNWSVSASKLDHSLTYNFSVRNESDQAIAIDEASVFMWVETLPTQTGDAMTIYNDTLVGKSMWTSMGDVSALLQSDAEPTYIAVGGTYASSITATTGTAESDRLATLLAGGEPFRVSLWAVVHEPSPSGDATYLIQLGSNNDASWTLSGGGAAP